LLVQVLEAGRIVLSLAFFIYASWADWKSREVSNSVWIVLAPIAFALTTVQFILFSPELFLNYALSFGITSGLAIILFYLGAFGGADAKALMCLALALPVFPTNLLSGFVFISPLFPLTVFSNAVVLAAFTVVYALLRNALWRVRNGSGMFVGFEKESVWRKLLVLITGYKVDVVVLEKHGHVYPLEDLVAMESGEHERRLMVFPKDETQETIMARLVSAGKEGKLKNGVWVTPGLPLLIFITAGLVIALVFGDIVWAFLRSVLLPY
jgi:preflagellin peptidase FlaK